MQRRDFIAGMVSWPVFVPTLTLGQQSLRPVIGFIGSVAGKYDATADFRKGLGEIGFIEGQNVAIEYRWTEGRIERAASLVKDLIDRHVSVIVAVGSTPVALAAKAATQTIPIAFVVGADPVDSGLVASIARPGGNVTGIFTLTGPLGPKRLEMLREVLPAGATVALLVNPAGPNSREIEEIAAAARLMGLRLITLKASSALDIYDTFAGLAQREISGILTIPDRLFLDQSDALAGLAARKSIAAIGVERAFAEAGGLMSYGPDFQDNGRLVGVYVGRILKGDKPSDLPVQQSTKIELVINMKTAKTLGIVFPLTILGRADAVIE